MFLCAFDIIHGYDVMVHLPNQTQRDPLVMLQLCRPCPLEVASRKQSQIIVRIVREPQPTINDTRYQRCVILQSNYIENE